MSTTQTRPAVASLFSRLGIVTTIGLVLYYASEVMFYIAPPTDYSR